MNTTTIIYEDNGQTLEAFVANPFNDDKKHPVMLIYHAWNGRGDFVCEKAIQMAMLGYVGIAMDVYGKGFIGTNKEENEKLSKPFFEDRNMLKRRLLAGIEHVKTLNYVDTDRLVVMGFCFGGMCALDIARAGVDVKGAISFHGLLFPPEGIKSEKITSKILVLHGEKDPLVPPQQVVDFQKEMTDANVDWQLVTFGNTYHAFTNPIANDVNFDTVYSSVAEQRSHLYMKQFLDELFSKY